MLSQQTNRSEFQIIREAVEEYIVQTEPEFDSMAAIVGLITDPNAPSDLSANRDRYLHPALGELHD